MQRPSICSISFPRATRQAALVLALAGTSIASGSVHAQTGVLVADTINQKTNAAMAVFQKGAQYANAVAQLKQLMSQIQGLTTGMSLLPNTMQHADADSLIQMNCAGASGTSLVGSLMNDLASSISPTQPIAQSQMQICAKLITTQVDKYNKTVDMLNQLNTYSTMYSKVEAVGNSISTFADSGRANNQAANYNNALTTQMANWDSQMKADDAIIKTLEAQQSQLSKAAFGAHPDLLGEATQAVALKAAFSIGN
ncbi:hypothetical protein ACPPVV_03715 [Rhodanobacter sp. Col0626]|uniref:hypothetical protein n=1 Tax=Rhodanobacter sp. Col0626 TaxID=3415679 RepID=UPI003CE82822